MKIEDYDPAQIERIEYYLALAAMAETQQLRTDQLDKEYGTQDLAVMVGGGFLSTVDEQWVLSLDGLGWITFRLIAQRVERGLQVQPARLRTHQPTMRRWLVREVPIGSIVSLYGNDMPHEIKIVNRRAEQDYLVLDFEDGTSLPYMVKDKVYAFTPLGAEAC